MTNPLRVLFVSAAPARDISTEAEFKRVRNILDRIPDIELHPVFCATVHDLQDELIKRDVQIVHLAAHGGQGTAQLEDEGGPWGGQVPAGTIIELLRHHASLRCVVLNACYSASWIAEPLGPALVAMRGPIGDSAALAFSEGFYRSIAAGRLLPHAFEQGRLRARIEAPHASFDPQFHPDCFGVIGIRTQRDFNEKLHDRCQYFCNLEPYFAGSEPDWTGAVAHLAEFVARTEFRPRPDHADNVVNLDCRASIALHLGRLFGSHSNVFPMASRPIREVWKPDHGLPVPDDSPWEIHVQRSVGARKLAVSISLTHDTRPLVEAHLRDRGVPTTWIDFRPLGNANPQSVRGPDHANALARTLAQALPRLRTEHGFEAIDLYFATPNAFLFLLGQQGVALGTLHLHEKVFQQDRYVSSFTSK